MTEVIKMVLNNNTWIKARVLVSEPEKGYVDMKLRNNRFCAVQLRNPYEAEVRIPSLGGFTSLIGTSDLCLLLDKLSH